ncbi:alanine dehydrogenase [Rhodocytophaga rosea]|uniref:Saccharopine dehydrogenase [NAD(+), L-lysine-forming] n=1 Tax=Rhodocytophaga rosea TaxID=2704465 RepID=A0A6C0GHS5_9BACT|nr:NAD(P)-dependent oxidoreductase [Rhodocytophaga rosea]QHT67445.1 alanine dehydrogenase [Rhodocytophaga rosea]
MKFGIIREGKVPPDRRVALLPHQCKEIVQLYPEVQIFVQPSPIRCVPDEQYSNAGILVMEDLSQCDVLFGIKEVPVAQLLPDKTYFFFSHTVKKQKYNRLLLQTILKRNITLIDYECLIDNDTNRQRIIAFGRYAGIVGAYNAFWTYGKKYQLFELKRARDCQDMQEMRQEYLKIQLPPIKIAVTGSGRVGKGVVEVLEAIGIQQVSPDAFLQKQYNKPVFTVLRSQDYHLHKSGNSWNAASFHLNPQEYNSSFYPFAAQADILITSAFWHPQAPLLFSKEDMLRKDFRIKVVADISCDVDGSVPCTVRTTTITDPVYDYDVVSREVKPPFSSAEHITVMAIDNLPCELPYDASGYFGHQLINQVLPHLLNGDKEGVLEKATITRNGQLTERYKYLSDFVSEYVAQ